MQTKIVASIAFFAAVSTLLSGCSAATGEAVPRQTSNVETSAKYVAELNDKLPEDIKNKKVLRIAVSTTGAPMASKRGDEVVGIVPDLAERASKILGLDVEWVVSPFSGLIPSLQSGRADMAWLGLRSTPERREIMDFVPYIKASDTLLVIKGNPNSLDGIDDLCGHTAGTVKGTVEAQLLQDQQNRCTTSGRDELAVKLYDTQGDAQTGLRAGKVNAVMGTTLSMRMVAKEVDAGNAFEVLSETYPTPDFNLGVPKGNEKLANAMQETIKALIDSGDYAEILDFYDAKSEALSTEEITMNSMG